MVSCLTESLLFRHGILFYLHCAYLGMVSCLTALLLFRYGIRFNCIAPGPIETEGAFGNLDPTGMCARRAGARKMV